MENVVWLQPDKPLTINAIQSILLQGASLKYAPNDRNLSAVLTGTEKNTSFSISEIKDYALGFGTEVPAEITRVMLLLLADFIAKHPVSNGPAIIARILEFHQFDVFPQVFTQGLLASPTAHALLPVFGLGKIYYQGYLLHAADVHDIFSWPIITWSDNFPASLQLYSFLGLATLVYSFIQFKQIREFAHLLFSRTDFLGSSDAFFQTQTDNLESQLQKTLTFSEEHTNHVSGLGMLLTKLLATFGEQVFEFIVDEKQDFKEHLSASHDFKINLNLVLRLLEQLSQENLSMLEANDPVESNRTLKTGNPRVMQPYQALLNLEQIMALATIIQFNSVKNNLNFKNSQLANTYLNQVISVLKEANFAELIRKTVSFMYANCKTNNPVA